MNSYDTVVICAELTELAPLVNRSWLQECLAHLSDACYSPSDPEKILPAPLKDLSGLRFYPMDLPEYPREVLAVQSGVGIVNAARTATVAIEVLGAKQIIYSGTAGGLAADSQVGEVIFGDTYVLHNVNATAFGYPPGQLPGMPSSYPANEKLVSAARSLLRPATDAEVVNAGSRERTRLNLTSWEAAGHKEEKKLPMEALGGILARCGTIATGDSFITDANVNEVRHAFPAALAAEMESAAAAQVAYLYGIPFLAVRCISDLCSPAGQEVYHGNAAVCGAVAAAATACLLHTL
ncbi:5'-methylthioadenosine/S-adenosylhomocysteine nucleosidase [Varibaculum vaginae]|uniref:5'-methylthioadenosine/S-adenosylhomocysteine nucleosidase n=1 Tax=Varibaculum vaginae TaxID=2364797 RepID=UPI000F088561|nr:5'-methylthioadenosine/S-adenosylhomocysteine nucleosidase [Varibaculum vaginae]